MNMKKTLLVAAIAASFSTAVYASNWKSGAYAGAVLGVGVPSVVADDYNQYISDSSYQEINNIGGTYGFDLGYNWLVDPTTVLGVEGDFSGTTITGSANLSYPNAPGAGSLSSDWHNLTTLRARAGILAGNALLFVTGGFAGIELDASGSYAETGNPGNNAAAYSTSSFRPGIVGGAGFEYRLPNSPLSIKADVIYISTTALSTQDEITPGNANQYKVTASGMLTRLGLNYNF